MLTILQYGFVLVCSEAKSNASTGWVTSGTEEFNKEASFVEGCVVTNLDDLGLKGHIPPEIDILKAVPIDNLWKAQKVSTLHSPIKVPPPQFWILMLLPHF